MNPLLSLSPSAVETRRFGLNIARLVLTDEEMTSFDGPESIAQEVTAIIHESQSDLVILRYPAERVDLFAQLNVQVGLQAWYADTLIYWAWRTSDPGNAGMLEGGGLNLVTDLEQEQLQAQVRTVFADYPNHYAANPLLDPEAALAGYVEWVELAVTEGKAKWLTLVDSEARSAAFAVVDCAASLPDIMLAGVEPEHRGHGTYKSLVSSLMGHATVSGWPGLTISTQAHNTPVQKTWARLGWAPTHALVTVHLVNDKLIERIT